MYERKCCQNFINVVSKRVFLFYAVCQDRYGPDLSAQNVDIIDAMAGVCSSFLWLFVTSHYATFAALARSGICGKNKILYMEGGVVCGAADVVGVYLLSPFVYAEMLRCDACMV